MSGRFADIFRLTVSCVLALSIGGLVSPLRAEPGRVATAGEKSHSTADLSDPIKTYRTYLEAIKRDDLAAAKACCTISDDDKAGSLDVYVGVWVTFHHFNKVALEHFKDDVRPYLEVGGADPKENPYLRRDCTDKALELTISRLPGSKFRIKGDKAWLTIAWDKDDGSPNDVFCYQHEALLFRKIHGLWKVDFMPEDARPEDLAAEFKPGSWGRAFRDGRDILDAVIKEIEAGKLKTWKQVTGDLEKRLKVFEREWIKDHDDTQHVTPRE